MQNIGVFEDPWIDQYSWAMPTMLGFGNAAPANPKEAIFISIIQCFSCVLLDIAKQDGDKLKNCARKTK